MTAPGSQRLLACEAADDHSVQTDQQRGHGRCRRESLKSGLSGDELRKVVHVSHDDDYDAARYRENGPKTRPAGLLHVAHVTTLAASTTCCTQLGVRAVAGERLSLLPGARPAVRIATRGRPPAHPAVAMPRARSPMHPNRRAPMVLTSRQRTRPDVDDLRTPLRRAWAEEPVGVGEK